MSDGGHGGGGGGHKRRGGHEEHEEHENHERWLVSYADMMTLLMVLFIVLFAISQVDSKKFMALKTGLASGFGEPISLLAGGDALLDVGGAVAPDSVNLAGATGGQTNQLTTRNGQTQTTIDPNKVAQLVNATNQASVKDQVDNLKKAQAEIQKALDKAGEKNAASFMFDERGLHIVIATDKVLFDNGKADLLPEGRKILDAVVPTLKKLPNKLTVDGHTNSIPISTAQFPSNWELSTARATGVLRYMIPKMPDKDMYATGFADTRPLRTVPKGVDPLVANRRVEIVVLAALDNGLGQAFDKLANKQDPTPVASSTASPEASPSGETGTPAAEPSPAASATEDDPWAKPSPSPKPTKASDWTQDTPSTAASPADWTQ